MEANISNIRKKDGRNDASKVKVGRKEVLKEGREERTEDNGRKWLKEGRRKEGRTEGRKTLCCCILRAELFRR